MTGRRLWFVGIGGAGLSAYAQLARAWGAEVGGWDRVRTPYLEELEGVRLEISPEPVVPSGWEAVVSSAYPAVPGTSRGAFLRELVSSRPSIVVAGTHGKGTTAAMIAYVLRETGRDPAWLIGAPVPQLGSNAGFGAGHLVVEGDESDRTVFSLPAEVAVVTNVELDHHTEFSSAAELRDAFESWLDGAGARGARRAPFDGALALPGAHNRENAGAAFAALELVGVTRDGGGSRCSPASRAQDVDSRCTTRRHHARRRLRPSSDRAGAHDRSCPGALARRDRARALPAASLLAHTAPRR